MLQKLREKTTGWIAVVIVGILAIPFVFVGLDRYTADDVGQTAARVESPPTWWSSAPHVWPITLFWDSREVGQQQLQLRTQQTRQMMQEQLGEQFDSRDFDTPEVRRQLLERLVDEALLRLDAERTGLQVTDAMVRDEIAGQPVFQIDGRFDPERYRLALAGAGMSPAGYEQNVRQDLLLRLLPGEIGETALVDDGTLEEFLRLSGQRRDLRWVEVSAAGAEPGAPSEEALEGFYREHALRYTRPEQVALEYVEITPQMLPEVGEPDEAALRRVYAEQAQRFSDAEQRLASHILIQVPAGADAEEVDAARRTAAELAEQARRDDADFAELAREHSQDLGSRATGGDLGWLEPGIAEEAFDEVLFALSPGEIGDPVRTGEGWHVIAVREARGGARQSFEEVRETLAGEYVGDARQAAYAELSGRLVDEVYRDPTALESAARELELPLQTTPLFARGEGEGIAAHPEAQRAAFSEAGLRGEVSDPIELGPNHLAFVRVREHRQAEPIALDEIRDRVIADYQVEARAEAARAQAEALLARAREQAGLDALAEDEGLAIQEAQGVGRDDASPAPEVVREAFRLAHPSDAGASYGLARIDDRYVLLAVTAVHDGDTSAVQGPIRDMLREQLAGLYADVELRGYLDALRGGSRVRVIDAPLP